ncbi:MAG: sulfite exporter TauE/SafE family protein [Henriciella sp.]|nr:sulfite exporter TauE/SafE family protein [Henriciella sp.]
MAEFFAEYAILILALVACGLFSGLVAGLFGIGGGAVIVPVLFFLFSGLGFDQTAQHVAVATSLATIILTSARSVMAHHRRSAVDWTIIKTWSPWIVLGAVLGMSVASRISGAALTLLFGVVAFLLAAQLYFGRPGWRLAEAMPGGFVRAGLGSGIGALSALMGIGGGTFGVSLMTVCGRTMHTAVATGAGFGVAIGLPAALAAIPAGWDVAARPPFSLGYVNVPAFVLISVFTVLMAPVGAKLAHALDAGLLKKLFAVLLVIVAVRMIWSAIGG